MHGTTKREDEGGVENEKQTKLGMEKHVALAPIAAALHEQEHALVAKRARAKSEHETIEADEKNRSRNDPLEAERPGEVLMRSPQEEG